jgi:hypothetical protein
VLNQIPFVAWKRGAILEERFYLHGINGLVRNTVGRTTYNVINILLMPLLSAYHPARAFSQEPWQVLMAILACAKDTCNHHGQVHAE